MESPLRAYVPAFSGVLQEKSMLINAFSANMLATFPSSVTFTEISVEEARVHLLCLAEAAGEADAIHSAVGHADTAAVFAAVLELPVPCNRATVTLKPGDRAILGQYKGPRLPEGAVELPEGAEIVWIAVEVAAPAACDRHAAHLRGNDPSISWEEQDAYWRS